MKKAIALLSISIVCVFGGVAAAQDAPHADMVVEVNTPTVDPVPGGTVSYTVSLSNNLDAMNGMSFTPVVTPLDGGSAADLQFSGSAVLSGVQSVVDAANGNISDISSPSTAGYAMFSESASDTLPPITGDIAELIFTYDDAAVAGNSYDVNLDMTWEELGGGSRGTKSYVTTGNGFDATFVPSEFWMGETKLADTGTHSLTEDNVTVTFSGEGPLIPEPTTMLLLGGGLIGLVGLRRRK